MRLGAPIFESYADPDAWIAAVQRRGYRAAYCPVKPGADAATIRAYAEAAERADIVIAECGAWSNPLSADEGHATRSHRQVPGHARAGRRHRRALLRQHRRLARATSGTARMQPI